MMLICRERAMPKNGVAGVLVVFLFMFWANINVAAALPSTPENATAFDVGAALSMAQDEHEAKRALRLLFEWVGRPVPDDAVLDQYATLHTAFVAGQDRSEPPATYAMPMKSAIALARALYRMRTSSEMKTPNEKIIQAFDEQAPMAVADPENNRMLAAILMSGSGFAHPQFIDGRPITAQQYLFLAEWIVQHELAREAASKLQPQMVAECIQVCRNVFNANLLNIEREFAEKLAAAKATRELQLAGIRAFLTACKENCQ